MKILKNISIDEMLFIDIETVRCEKKLKNDTPLFESWQYKMRYARDTELNDDVYESFDEKAALYSEFGKIACITLGYVRNNKLRLNSYSNDNELSLLKDFNNDLQIFVDSKPKLYLVGHAIKGFDIPYIFRRSIVNGIEPHPLIDTSGEKPWTMEHLVDTLELWKGTGFYSASLLNIAVALGIESPKTDMDGSETSNVYWNEKNGLERIVKYCERDVLTTANIVRKFKFEKPLILDEGIIDIKKEPLIKTIANRGKILKKEHKILLKFSETLSENGKLKMIEILKAVAEVDEDLENKIIEN